MSQRKLKQRQRCPSGNLRNTLTLKNRWGKFFIPLLGWTHSMSNSFFHCTNMTYKDWKCHIFTHYLGWSWMKWERNCAKVNKSQSTHLYSFCGHNSPQTIQVGTVSAQKISDKCSEQTDWQSRLILPQQRTVHKQFKSATEVYLQWLVKLSANDSVECVLLKQKRGLHICYLASLIDVVDVLIKYRFSTSVIELFQFYICPEFRR